MVEKKKVTWTIAQIKSQAALKLKGNYGPMIAVILISSMAIGILDNILANMTMGIFRFFFINLIFTTVISALITGSFTMGTNNCALNIAKNIKPSVSDIGIGFTFIGKAISLNIVFQLINLIFSAVMGILTYLFYGYSTNVITINMLQFNLSNVLFLLLSVPFVLFIIGSSIKLAMTWFILIENPEMSLSDIVNRSLGLMKGNLWKLIGLTLSFLGWVFFALILVAGFAIFISSTLSVFILVPILLACFLPLISQLYVSVAQFYICLTGRENEYFKESA